MRFIYLCCVGLIWAIYSASALAQVPNTPPVEDPEPVIALSPQDTTDQKIQDRISTIFEKIEAIDGVVVAVDAGVVTLSGEVANDAAAQDARDIAIRTAGVVTIEDNINRTLDVRGNVTPFIESVNVNSKKFVRALPLILLSFIVFLSFVLLGGWLARRKSLWQKIAPNPFLAEIFSQIIRLAFWVLGAIIALNLVGASGFVATILGGAGVVGIAIGFAVRDSLENYISSIMLSLRQPFRAKDHVVINDKEGIVVRLTSRATILMTVDGNHLRIPNSTVFKGIILNYTTNPERRFEFELGVDADDDPISAIQVGMDALRTHEFVLNDPEPFAIIKTVGDSNIVLDFYGWVDQTHTDFAKARSQAIHTVKSALEAGGFTLPEPIYRLRLQNAFDGTLKTITDQSSAKPDKTNKTVTKAKSRTKKETTEFTPPVMDVSKDRHLEDKVNEERLAGQDADLLDGSKPIE
ncbi:mechanosensitive ion channel domain-containing protein [Litorimonas sp. RW-G-Af-16]|uniref:mechanosensitive ion channel domain-containing protein n=1 Tax=Litorimonas sp. RW-G-Af-16 TaxID=3241168 RepID=UPI00390C40F6